MINMDGRVHVPVGFMTCLVVYVLTYYYFGNGDTFSLAFFGIIGSILPDLDQLMRRHRDALTHSALFPFLTVIYMLGWNINRYYDVFFFMLAYGFHLLLDLKIKKEGKLGTYCIVKPGFVKRKKKKSNATELGIDRMSAKNTDKWLLLNAVACFVSCFVLYLLF